MAVITVDKSTVYGLDSELLALQQADSTEATTRANEDTRIEGLISTASSSQAGEITRVEGLISAETTARTSADQTITTNLTDKINVEASARVAKDTQLEGRLDIVQGADTVDGSISKTLKDAKAYADSLVATTNGDIDALETIVTLINADSDTVGSFRNAITNVVGLAPETLNTLQEIAASIANDPNLDSTLRTLITTTVDSAKAEIRGAVSESLDTLAEVETALNVLNNPDETVEGSLAKILKDSKDWANGQIITAVSAEETARIGADQAIQSELNATQLGAGLQANGSYSPFATGTYISNADNLWDADKKLDVAIKALDDNTYSKTETDDLVRNGGAIFKTEVITVVDNKITLAFAPKNGMIFNFGTVRHTDAQSVSWDIPVIVTATAGGKEFQLYPNTTGQFDGKAVTVQYAY